MKTVRMSIALASMVGAAALFLVAPDSMSASPATGWDNFFYTGEHITAPSEGTAKRSAPSQEFDLFNTGEGVKVEDFKQAYMGTSLGSAASRGWDIYHVGDGDPLR